MLQIRNLRTNTESIHQSLCTMHGSRDTLDTIHGMITRLCRKVEKVCAKHGGTPADTGTPTFRLYLWLRYMADAENLANHYLGLREFIAILHRDHKEWQNSARSFLVVDYSGYLYHRRTAKGNTRLLIHEGFITAPHEIKQAVISAAYAKRKGKAANVVKAYAAGDGYQAVIRSVRGTPIANTLSCRGKHFHLDTVFAEVNARYFDSTLPQPRLVWSSARAKRRLGYYHPDNHTIALNRKLDSANTPRLLVRYIMYHEMLHQFFGIEHRNGRRYAHTKAFHAAEKKFEGYQEAENLIKNL